MTWWARLAARLRIDLPVDDPELRALVRWGCVGALLMLVGGLVVNELPPGPLRIPVLPLIWFGQTGIGNVVGTLVLYGGLALVAWAWWRLIAMLSAGSPARAGERLHVVRAVAVRWMAPLAIAPPLFSHDGWSYMAQGALAEAGRDPYRISPGEMPELLTLMVDPIWRYTATPYGPLPITWGAVWTEVFKDPTFLLLVQRIPVFAGLAATAWALARLATRLRLDPALVTALVLVSPFMLAHGVAGLHNDVVIMALLLCALELAARGGWKVPVALIGVAAAVKFTAVVGVVPVVLLTLPRTATLWERFRRLAAGGIFAALVLAIAGLPYGLGFGWIEALRVPGVVMTPASLPTAIGTAAQWISGHSDDGSDGIILTVARSIGMALAVVIVVWLALRRPTGRLRSALLTCVGVYAAIIMLAPVVQTWYALTLLPVAVLLLLPARRQVALVLCAVPGVLTYIDSKAAGGSLLLALAVMAWMVRQERSRPLPLTRRR